MSKKNLALFLVIALSCTTIFLGCAGIPKEELDQRDAMIKALNTEINSLGQEITDLRKTNMELAEMRSDLEQKLNEAAKVVQQLKEELNKKTKTEKTEADIK